MIANGSPKRKKPANRTSVRKQIVIACLSYNTVIASRCKRRGSDILPKPSCPEGVDPEILGFTPSRHEKVGRISRTPSGHKSLGRISSYPLDCHASLAKTAKILLGSSLYLTTNGKMVFLLARNFPRYKELFPTSSVTCR